MTYLDFGNLFDSIEKYADVKKDGFAIPKEDDETEEAYKKKTEDFKLLMFLLKATSMDEIRRGMPLPDGSFKSVTVYDVCRLMKDAAELVSYIDSANDIFSSTSKIGQLLAMKDSISEGSDDWIPFL